MSPGKKVKLCSAEDLIILKSFASRTRDWEDVKSIIARQGDLNLDWNYIIPNLSDLAQLKEEPEILSNLNNIRTHLKIHFP